MTLVIGALTIGLILSVLALGVYISFRIFDFPDITAEGSITLGAAVAAILLVAGTNPFVATTAAFCAGMALSAEGNVFGLDESGRSDTRGRASAAHRSTVPGRRQGHRRKGDARDPRLRQARHRRDQRRRRRNSQWREVDAAFSQPAPALGEPTATRVL